MPRRPRVIIEGGLYHLYNRFARGEEIFADPEEAVEFLELLRALKKRDDFVVYAWCLMSNHFHVAVRTSAIPLSRTMRTLQGGYSRAFNRRWRRTGPLWQSRYQARLVDDQRYFDQLLVYIHLNPVRAGVVKDPKDHVFCGHRELIERVSTPLIDVDETLLGFGATVKSARRIYLKLLNATLAAEERTEVSERMPWWTNDRDMEPSTGRSYVDELGRSTGLPREELEGTVFLELACQVIGIKVGILASSRKDRETTRLRLLIASVGIERWGQRPGVLGPILGKHPDVVSRWVRLAADRKHEERGFSETADHLDRSIFELSSPKVRSHK
jgi:REP element-mobilizing transposase RayT